MPCYDCTPQQELSDTISVLRERESQLCEAMRFITDSGELDHFIVEHFDEARSGTSKRRLEAWWKKHQRLDREREEREKRERAAEEEAEKTRKRAISKLTKKEIKALGLEAKK